MRVKSQHSGESFCFSGIFDQIVQKFLVTLVDAVKVSDRQRNVLSGFPDGVHFGKRGENVHRLSGCPEHLLGGMGPDYSDWANNRAARMAKYVRIMVAPALRIDRRDSIMALSVSIHPSFPAAMIVAYSPLTW